MPGRIEGLSICGSNTVIVALGVGYIGISRVLIQKPLSHDIISEVPAV